MTTLLSETSQRRRARLFLAGTAIAAVAGGIFAMAAPASAVQPRVTVQKFQAYNHADSYGYVQHWDKVGSKYYYANWAPRGSWSSQGTCWAGVTSYHYNFKS
jgi:hypothetical protein